MTLYATTRLDQLSEQRGTRVKAGDQDVLLVRMGDQVRAYQADCPHAGAPLEDGAICEQRLVCPWHKGAFAITDGEVTEPPALMRLERYPAHVEAGTVWVDDQPEPAPTPALVDEATLRSPNLTLLQDAVTHVDSEAKTLTLADRATTEI